MTTAARPTFDTARGGAQRGEGNLSMLTKQYSSRDLPSHTKIKTRQFGQNTIDELRGKDFKHDLLDRERSSRDKNKKNSSSDSMYSAKRARLEHGQSSSHSSHTIDADDPVDDDEEDSDDSDNDDDDTSELLAELQRIKRDRAEEMIKREQEKSIEEERIRTENLLSGNPLLNKQPTEGDFKVNRRWDDDVVFKNCAKDDDKPKGHGFINDTIRSEFHKKFMNKYIK